MHIPEGNELGVSVLRNEHLANIFYRLNLIEAYGTGITKIRQNYIKKTVQPKIEVTKNAFKITLPNLNYVSVDPSDTVADNQQSNKSTPKIAKEERESAVLILCKKNGSVSRKDVQEALQVSQSTATLLLNKMIENGSIRKTGCGKEIRYII